MKFTQFGQDVVADGYRFAIFVSDMFDLETEGHKGMLLIPRVTLADNSDPWSPLSAGYVSDAITVGFDIAGPDDIEPWLPQGKHNITVEGDENDTTLSLDFGGIEFEFDGLVLIAVEVFNFDEISGYINFEQPLPVDEVKG